MCGCGVQAVPLSGFGGLVVTQIYGVPIKRSHGLLKRSMEHSSRLRAAKARVIFGGTPAGGVLRRWKEKGGFALH